ncbi:MAG TPA: glycoside hydrolase family 15 protein [Acidimicrobiales bacterium]
MALPIEDYGLIGDTHTAALVGRNGSIDWLCLPRFDSDACFAALLGTDEHGYWRIAPATPDYEVRRRYRGDTLVLETEFETADGIAKVVDCMPIREDHPQVLRMVEAVRGQVAMRMDLVIRFGYGSLVPWVRRADGLLCAVAGPDALALWTPIDTRGEDMKTVADFTVTGTEHIPFVLTWYPSHQSPPRPVDVSFAVHDTQMWWEDWAATCTFDGEWRDPVMRSLITLKALTYQPTGGIVAAATTSLPETLGGERNWDYRYCWLRDATLTLESLMRGGYHEEALAWRDWLLRAVAGDVTQLQIMYGPAGERRLDEWEVGWLPGYEGSAPVRVGNAASGQFQLDVYGEVLSALFEACGVGSTLSDSAWDLQKALVEFVAGHWEEPDEGIWEVRGPRRHFTHSKVMAWVAVDRAVRTIEEFGVDGPLERWRQLRDQIHEEVCAKGYNADVGAFTQYYGSDALDASLLMIPLVGFLTPEDERVRSTVEVIERGLTEDGFVLRYRTQNTGAVDGLTGHEGAFLACSFWMADCLYMIGRYDDAHAMLDRLIGLRNDLGLLAEEYDVRAGRQVGNFPQAFSHVSLVNAAYNLSGHPAMEEQVVMDEHLVRSAATRSRRSSSMHGLVTTRRSRAARRGDDALAQDAPPVDDKAKNSKRKRAR